MLEGRGRTGEQAVCLSRFWVPAQLPVPTPHPSSALSLVCPEEAQLEVQVPGLPGSPEPPAPNLVSWGSPS